MCLPTVLMQILYPYIKCSLGTLYPAYKTWKALKRKDETTRRRWMKYWISFAAFQAFELVADIFAFLIPFYIEAKIVSILLLVFLGTKLIYDSIVNRELAKREKYIDRYLNKAAKVRDELVATIWYEFSRCSVEIITKLMSGGMSVVLAKSSEQNHQISPVCSDDEETDQELSLHYIEPDFNENMVSMEWQAITLNGTHTNNTAKQAILNSEPRSSSVAIRKSARREQKSLRSSELE